MLRSLTPELLETLPHDHSDALASRQDLICINRVMGNTNWLVNQLQAIQSFLKVKNWAELGAGDGSLGNKIIHALGVKDYQIMGLDFAPRPQSWPLNWDWHQGNLEQWNKWSEIEGLIACLVLHHFSEQHLQNLGKKIQQNCRCIIAVEPVRKKLHLWQANLLTLGMNRITKHDASISVKAGFQDNELAQALCLNKSWQVIVRQTWRGAYRFIAWRK